ncbi:hypothetical protein SAMN05216175_104276 [Neptunomonas qingdaonensis]|uniref:Uncharacterized protein n=1 Tax=Neptunomonas qingdaonensis TaxID=1045558 RepID=A0A1I2Q7B5_9GAMM|nr:hypothetical protein SAMN05216175_104276 [Neptunomonas qingdaonensis]
MIKLIKSGHIADLASCAKDLTQEDIRQAFPPSITDKILFATVLYITNQKQGASALGLS